MQPQDLAQFGFAGAALIVTLEFAYRIYQRWNGGTTETKYHQLIQNNTQVQEQLIETQKELIATLGRLNESLIKHFTRQDARMDELLEHHRATARARGGP